MLLWWLVQYLLDLVNIDFIAEISVFVSLSHLLYH